MKVLERPGTDPVARGLLHAHRRGSLPLRPVRALPAPRSWTPTATGDVEILSPTSQNAYDGLGTLAKPFVRTGWRALLCADMLQKLLLHPPSVRRAPRRHRSGLRRVAWTTCAARSRTTPVEPGRATGGAARCHGARAATVSAQLAVAPRPRRAADRHRGRDLLPAEHVLQREPGAVAWRNTAPRRGSPTSWSGSGTPTPSTSAS